MWRWQTAMRGAQRYDGGLHFAGNDSPLVETIMSEFSRSVREFADLAPHVERPGRRRRHAAIIVFAATMRWRRARRSASRHRAVACEVSPVGAPSPDLVACPRSFGDINRRRSLQQGARWPRLVPSCVAHTRHCQRASSHAHADDVNQLRLISVLQQVTTLLRNVPVRSAVASNCLRCCTRETRR